jgi:hypothetical protein
VPSFTLAARRERPADVSDFEKLLRASAHLRTLRDRRAHPLPSGLLLHGHPTAGDGEFRRDIACAAAVTRVSFGRY